MFTDLRPDESGRGNPSGSRYGLPAIASASGWRGLDTSICRMGSGIIWPVLRIALGIALFACLASAAPPNIVLILTDDQGWGDVGYHGAEFPTPNIDRIAKEGVELDRFYVTPICTPTRAGLLSGRYPLRFGLQRVTVKRWGRRAIPDHEVLLPAMLAKAGYETRAMTGKWHLGWSRRSQHPISHGFTSFYGLGGGAIEYFTHHQHGGLDWHRDLELNRDKGYATTLIGDEAVRVIEQASDEAPFFLYVAFNAIHTPNDALPQDLKRFQHIPDEQRRAKAAMTTSLDREIGRILEALDDKGVADDTLVLFLCDNGGALPSGSVNAPLRDGKWSVYEGGIRVAAAIRWPAGLPGGRKMTEPMSYVDVYPTLMRVAGVDEHGGEPLDGEDMLDLLRGERTRDDWVFHSYFRGQRIPQNSEPEREILFERNAVNTKQWKLVRLGPDAQKATDLAWDAVLELYRIDQDPHEKNDVAARHPEIVEKLLARMRKFRDTQKSPLTPVTIQPPEDWSHGDFEIPAK